MKKFLQKIKRPTMFVLAGFFVLIIVSLKAQAAPDITVKNMAGSGAFTVGNPITFTYDVVNQGDGMDTTNSYGFVVTGKYIPPANEQTVKYHDLDLKNGKAYVSAGWPFVPSAGTNTLSIFDISGAGDPIRLGRDLTVNPTMHGYSSILLDNYVYVVGMKEDGAGVQLGYYLRTYDISDPNNPVLKNEKSTTDYGGIRGGDAAQGIFMYGNYLYVETWMALQVWDVSNRANPTYVRELVISNNNNALSRDPVEGRYLYRANNYTATLQELEIYDLANPANPVKVGGFDFADMATAVAVRNNNAFVVTYRNPNTTLHILDISNRANPVELGSVSFSSGAVGGNSILLRGNQAIVGNGSRSAMVFDVSDLAAPKLISESRIATTRIHEFNAIDNSKIYVTESTAFEVFEPHVFSRVCIDNPNCLTDETGRLGSDADAGLLTQNGIRSITAADYIPATTGSHTAYFCSDVNRTSTFGSYDSVAESDETNNCYQISFTVFATSPILKICRDSCNSGVLAGSSSTPGSLNLTRGDIVDLVACYNVAADCSDPTGDVTTSASTSWTEVSSNNTVSFLAPSGSTKKISATNSGTENISALYLGKTAISSVTVNCFDNDPSNECAADPQGDNVCLGTTYDPTILDACGRDIAECPGRKSCTLNVQGWREVAP